MADRNICDVELLSSMSENTNVIVEENGVLSKLNLNDEIDNKITTAINNSKIGIGETQYQYMNTKSIASGVTVEMASFIVNKGVYIVTASVYFNDASSSVSGGRTVNISRNGTSVGSVIVKPYEWSTMAECVRIVNCTEDNTIISGNASQTSGSNLNVSGDLAIVRIA